MMRGLLRKAMLGSLAATVAFGSLLATSQPAAAADNEIVVWVSENQADYFQQVIPTTYQGYTVTLVSKPASTFLEELTSAQVDAAPDVAINTHEWTGQLVQNGTIVPLDMPVAGVRAFAPNVLDSFRYGRGIYGVPMQYANLAMITNRDLVRELPRTFDELATQALALKKAGKVTVPFAVPQGENGDLYHMQPLFTGLGGYIFGQNPNGTYNPKKLGIYNKDFAKNAIKIDQWNKTGLVSAEVDYATSKEAFRSGKSPFWITGPWEISTLKELDFPYTIGKVPPIVADQEALPFLDARGAWITKWADAHGVSAGATAMVTSFFVSPTFQLNLHKVDGSMPANLKAQKRVTDLRLKAFAAAGRNADPLPNIPQMNAVWGPLGTAWVNSTKGETATKAAKSFSRAQAAVKKMIS